MKLTKLSNGRSDERGIAHVALMAVILVILVGVIGGVGYMVMNKNKDKNADSQQASTDQQKTDKIECPSDLTDDDVCKFYKSFMEHPEYRMTTTTNNSTLILEVDGENSRTVATGDQKHEYLLYEGVGYTKVGNTWYKYRTEGNQTPQDSGKVDLEEPTTDTASQSPHRSIYKKLGKEACGNLQCFKYQIVDLQSPTTTEIVWFDDKDYQLRRMTVTAADGYSSELTFEYTNVDIKAPSPVKELDANQYIMPGSDEIVTMPSQ